MIANLKIWKLRYQSTYAMYAVLIKRFHNLTGCSNLFFQTES